MKIIFLLLTFMCSISLYGQNPKIEKAKKLITVGKTDKAITILRKHFNKTNDLASAKEIITIYNQLSHNDKALEWADKINLKESLVNDDVVQYATLLLNNQLFHQALKHCLDYAIENEANKAVYDLAYACEDLIKTEKNAVLYSVSTVPFNSPYDEISISNYRRNYIMSSNGSATFIEEDGPKSDFDFYILQQDYGRWRIPWLLLKDGDTKYNRTTLSFTYNGNEVYYTSHKKPNGKSNRKVVAKLPTFKIHFAIPLGDDWLKDSLLYFQNDTFSYKDPTIHPDGKLFVFSSNMNNEGHYDLYYIQKTDGVWSDPKSLGKQVNTMSEETMPYFNEAGDLYFSSNRPYGYGGYDILKTKLEGRTWIRPERMPPPINSEKDDLSIMFNYDQPGGFLVSNRRETIGGYDIFSFNEFAGKLNVNVLDNEIGSILSYAEVRLLRDSILLEEALTTEKGAVEFNVGPGVNYEIQISREKYLPLFRTVNTEALEHGKILYENVRLDKDPAFLEVKTEDSIVVNNQNFMTLKVRFEDGLHNALTNYPVKIFNMTQGKVKLLNTNSEGEIEQFLFIGNNYKFLIEKDGYITEKKFSTIDKKAASFEHLLYTVKSTADSGLIEKEND